MDGEFFSLRSDNILNLLNKLGKSFEHFIDISSFLHADDSELIFFINPHKGSLVLIMENSSSFGPFSFHAWELEIGVSTHEKEVIINQFLFISFVHA